MQKLDFVQGVEKVYKQMHSEEVIDAIETSLLPNTSKSGAELSKLLWDMYSNYNALMKDKISSELLEILNGEDLFTPNDITTLFQSFQGDLGALNGDSQSPKGKLFRRFLNFHYALSSTYLLTRKSLADRKVIKSLNQEGQAGIIVFQVLNKKSGLSTSEYAKILTKIGDLVEFINTIYGETHQTANVILLDSGSDTNIGIDTHTKTATAIFNLFKEIIGVFRFWRHDLNDKDNKTILDSLDVLSKVDEKVKNGTISEEDGTILKTKIKRSAFDLLGLNVLPKELKNDLSNVSVLNYLGSGTTGLLGEGVESSGKDSTPSEQNSEQKDL